MKPNDPLLERVNDRLKSRDAGRQAEEKAHYESRGERMRSDVNAFHRFAIQVGIGALWVWQHLLRPVRNAGSFVFRKLFYRYRQLWALSVYRRDRYNNLRLSKTRAGVFLAGTAVALWCTVGIFTLVWDSTLYLLTADRNETVFLTNSEEVDAEGNVHAVKGCESLPCSDVDSVYFRINPSLFNHLWSVFHNHTLFYPDYVAAAVPPGVNRCTVTSYGIRVKLLMRGMDIYPDILKASCEPVRAEAKG